MLSIVQSKTSREFHDGPILDAKGLHIAKRPKKFVPLGALDLIVLFRRLTINSVHKSEMLHRGEYLAKRIENLGHGGYLLVEVLAVNVYGKGVHWHIGPRGIDLRVNSVVGKAELGTVEPDVVCPRHELQELWNGKRELLEVANLEILEARSGDPTKNRF